MSCPPCWMQYSEAGFVSWVSGRAWLFIVQVAVTLVSHEEFFHLLGRKRLIKRKIPLIKRKIQRRKKWDFFIVVWRNKYTFYNLSFCLLNARESTKKRKLTLNSEFSFILLILYYSITTDVTIPLFTTAFTRPGLRSIVNAFASPSCSAIRNSTLFSFALASASTRESPTYWDSL